MRAVFFFLPGSLLLIHSQSKSHPTFNPARYIVLFTTFDQDLLHSTNHSQTLLPVFTVSFTSPSTSTNITPVPQPSIRFQHPGLHYKQHHHSITSSLHSLFYQFINHSQYHQPRFLTICPNRLQVSLLTPFLHLHFLFHQSIDTTNTPLHATPFYIISHFTTIQN